MNPMTTELLKPKLPKLEAKPVELRIIIKPIKNATYEKHYLNRNVAQVDIDTKYVNNEISQVEWNRLTDHLSQV